MSLLDQTFQRPTQSGGTKEKDIKAVVDAIFSNVQLDQKAVLERDQILHLARGRIYQDRFKSKTMRLLIDELLRLSISNKGRGRSDLRTILQSLILGQQEEGNSEGLAKRLFGI